MSGRTTMRVTVIGGGVAGAASAIALRRIGAEVTVHEAYEDPAGQVGSFLSLAVNGLRALDALQCGDAVREAGFEVADLAMVSSAGRTLGVVPRGRLSSEGMRSVTVARGRLVEVLRAEAERSGARIVTGHRLGSPAEADPDADLVVGADGIWSATRTALDPAAPVPAYAGLYSASGVSPDIGLPSATFHMVFARAGAFLYVPTPDGKVWWSAQVASPRPPDLGAVSLSSLAGLFRHEPGPAALLAAATELHRPTLMHKLPEVPVRHDARTVLIGDAAHPVGAGQGASMAIEDALALARCVAVAPSVAAGLAAYDAERRPRIARMLRAAADNRDAKTPGPLRRRINDALLPWALRYGYERSMAWLYTHDPGTLPTPAAR
ncbi:FAD-dependent monooxygenase [Streptomyces sp. NPDC002054]|uniref:FAD-dependent monooxygenase n=1 Tax=Streptomyces sp. NPDC002054 TaxID=3154663 RepID=UPI0033228A36